MRCSFVGLCLVGTIACAAHAEAEPGRQGREATATGCLQRGATPHSFVLQERGTDPRQAGGGITLVAAHGLDLSQYIGQKVHVSGVIPRRGGPEERRASDATRMTVREIQPLGDACTDPQPRPAETTTAATTTTGSAGQTGVTGNALLDGLINFNIQQLLVSIQFVTNVQDTVINVSDVLNGFQIQALIQALNSNPVASLNANNLSFALQQSGLLAAGETVVGVTPPAIRDNETLTKTLQDQGILLPGERVVGAKSARVYKMKS